MIKELFSSQKKAMTSPFDSSSKKKTKQIDRFIPHSVSKNLYSFFNEVDTNRKPAQGGNPKQKVDSYSAMLQENLMNDQSANRLQGKVLHFGQSSEEYEDKENMDINFEGDGVGVANHHRARRVSKQPYKILEAPLIKDDFYLNLVDWSDSNNIGVGLQSSLFVWSGCSSKVAKVYESRNHYEQICSVSFLRHSSKVSVGTNEGKVKIFDVYRQSSCHVPQASINSIHSGRIGSLDCTSNMVVTGGKDGYVNLHDIRADQTVFRYKAHQQEISGLKISPDGEMVATGGNDNRMLLFSMRMMDKMVCWDEHNAAVKAIGFNPKGQEIATGGGTADKKIRIFSVQTLQKLSEVDTGSQICNLRYSPVSNELVTTHGYSLNQIILWKYDQNSSLTKVDSLMGHKNRVLYLSGESNGSRIVTGAGDQELRLWKIFDDRSSQQNCLDLR